MTVERIIAAMGLTSTKNSPNATSVKKDHSALIKAINDFEDNSKASDSGYMEVSGSESDGTDDTNESGQPNEYLDVDKTKSDMLNQLMIIPGSIVGTKCHSDPVKQKAIEGFANFIGLYRGGIITEKDVEDFFNPTHVSATDKCLKQQALEDFANFLTLYYSQQILSEEIIHIVTGQQVDSVASGATLHIYDNNNDSEA